MTDELKTVIEAMDIPLDTSVYGDLHGHLGLEVRDFSTEKRTMIVRFWLAGTPYTVMVDWEKFTEEFDAMRARMMAGDWDTALTQLVSMGGDAA